MAEPGGLPSTGSHRVGHDWSHLAAAAEHTQAFRKETYRGAAWKPPVTVSGKHWGFNTIRTDPGIRPARRAALPRPRAKPSLRASAATAVPSNVLPALNPRPTLQLQPFLHVLRVGTCLSEWPPRPEKSPHLQAPSVVNTSASSILAVFCLPGPYPAQPSFIPSGGQGRVSQGRNRRKRIPERVNSNKVIKPKGNLGY